MEQLELIRLIVAVIADGVTDDGIVFLFDEAVIVFAIGTASGEGNVLGLAVTAEVVVDELTAVVGIDAAQRKGKALADILEGFEDVGLSFVFESPCFCPSGSNIGDIEGLGILTKGNAAVVGNKVDFDEAGESFIPVGKGANGDVMLEQGAWFGARTAFEATFGLGGS